MKLMSILKMCIACASVFLLASCGFKDIDKRVFVQAVGVDYTDNEEKPYKVTLKLAVPSGSLKESGTKYAYLTREDSSIAAAIRFLKTNVDKELDFSHAKLIVFDEQLFNRDIRDALDFFFRRRDIQMISWVAVGRPSAEKVLQVEPESEMAGSHTLMNFFSGNGVESAYIVSTFLFEARREVAETGLDPIIPIIRASEDGKKLMVNRSFIFSWDNRSAELHSGQTKMYNIMANRMERLEIEVDNQDKEKNFTVSIDTIKTKFKLLADPGKAPVLKMDIKAAGIMEESSFEMDPIDLDHYSKLASDHAKKDTEKLLKFLQKENMDPLGFGLRYKATRLQNGHRIDEWRAMYPDLKFDVSVDVNIKSTGTVE
ncbi:Ger(x)C family spore germination protein [Siminovitchia sediminis]|uniref:Ger(X)C family spore germination protein n=1 Tax=Siminovitchia sediminis TaxID=1274353 RepID=A0ABW4KGB9_9BACI